MSQSAKLEAMKHKITQQEVRLRDEKAKLKKLNRAADTRRKILYGNAMLMLIDELDEEKKRRTLKRLQDKITRDSDRIFLGLRKLERKA